MLFDRLRPPSLLDTTRAHYKDWLHLNVVDHETGCMGLFNVSLHGAPDDPRARAVGTALVHVPDRGWIGNVEVQGLREADIGFAGIGLHHVGLALDGRSDLILVSGSFPDEGLQIRATASPSAAVTAIEQRVPLGTGWISWVVVPRLQLSGTMTVGEHRIDLRGASAYHDHNWGRWRWGDDFGWEWGVFVTVLDGPVFVVSRTTDRAHRRHGDALVVVHMNGKRTTFTGRTVTMDASDERDVVTRRLPGAVAALHPDRAHPRLPTALQITADDGSDAITIRFRSRGAAQLIAGEPTASAYGFIHEMVGEFDAKGRIGSTPVRASGLGVFEHVD